MKNTSMREISSGDGRRGKFFGIACLPIAFAIYVVSGLILKPPGFIETEQTWLLVMGLAVVFSVLIVILMSSRTAHGVWESADGSFLRVKINWTEKDLPLSDIESVDTQQGRATKFLQVEVKRSSSSSGFSPGAIFCFTPNEAYFRSAFFRQFPLPGVKNLKDFRSV